MGDVNLEIKLNANIHNRFIYRGICGISHICPMQSK